MESMEDKTVSSHGGSCSEGREDPDHARPVEFTGKEQVGRLGQFLPNAVDTLGGQSLKKLKESFIKEKEKFPQPASQNKLFPHFQVTFSTLAYTKQLTVIITSNR